MDSHNCLDVFRALTEKLCAVLDSGVSYLSVSCLSISYTVAVLRMPAV